MKRPSPPRSADRIPAEPFDAAALLRRLGIFDRPAFSDGGYVPEAPVGAFGPGRAPRFAHLDGTFDPDPHRQHFANGGVPSLLAPHLAQGFAGAGLMRFHNALAHRPHFDEGGSAGGGGEGGGGEGGGGEGGSAGDSTGGFGGGYGGFGFGGGMVSAVSHGEATSNSGSGYSSGSPAGASTGGYGGFGGYSSSGSVGGSYGGDPGRSYSSSSVSSAGSSSANDGYGSVSGSFGQMGANDSYGGQMSSGGGSAGGYGSLGSVGSYSGGLGGFGNFNSTNTGGGVGYGADDGGFRGLNIGVGGSASTEGAEDTSMNNPSGYDNATNLNDYAGFLSSLGMDTDNPSLKSAFDNVRGYLAGVNSYGDTFGNYDGYRGGQSTYGSYDAPGAAPVGFDGYGTQAAEQVATDGSRLGWAGSPAFTGAGQLGIGNEVNNASPTPGFGSFASNMGFGNSSETAADAVGKNALPSGFGSFNAPASLSDGFASSVPTAQTPSDAFAAGVNEGAALATSKMTSGMDATGMVENVAPSSLSPSIQAAMMGHPMAGDVSGMIASRTGANPADALGSPGMGYSGAYGAANAAGATPSDNAYGYASAAGQMPASASASATPAMSSFSSGPDGYGTQAAIDAVNKGLASGPVASAAVDAAMGGYGPGYDGAALAGDDQGAAYDGGRTEYGGYDGAATGAPASPLGGVVGSPLASGLVSSAAVDSARNTYDAPSTATPSDGVTQDDLNKSFSDFSNSEQALSDAWSAPLAAGTQKAIEAVSGALGSMAGSVMGATPDEITGFMNNPGAYPEVGQKMISRLGEIGQEAQQPGFGWSHMMDSQAVNHMMSDGGFNDPQAAISAAQGFISSKMGEVSPSFGSVGTVAGLGNATAAPSDGTGVAYSGSAANEPAGFSTGSPATSTSTDPASVDGTPALTVHNPSFSGTAISGDVQSDGASGANYGTGISKAVAPGYAGVSQQQVANMVATAAIANGIDPNVAVKVAKSEGLGNYTGDQDSSFGPFQLHYGGVQGVNAGNAVAGMGDDFTSKTGLDARDPSTIQAQVNFAMQQVAATGNWNAFHGAARAGVGPTEGIGVNTSGFASAGPSDTSPAPGLGSAMADGIGRQGLTGATGLGAYGNTGADASQISRVGNVNDPLGSFANMDAGLTAAGVPGAPPSSAPAAPTSSPDSPGWSPGAASGMDGDAPTPTSAAPATVPGWVSAAIPGVGLGRTVMGLLGGKDASVDSPAMQRAAGNNGGGSSANPSSNAILSWWGNGGNGNSGAGDGSGGSASTSSAAPNAGSYIDPNAVAREAMAAMMGGESSGSTLPASNTNSTALASLAPPNAVTPQGIAFYNPMQDPVVLDALRLARAA